MAHALTSNGIDRFDRLAIWKANSLDYFLLSMAVIRLGGITVPINGGMSPLDLQAYLGKIGSCALCLDTEAWDRLRAAGIEPLTVAPRLLMTDAHAAMPKMVIDFAAAVRAASPDGKRCPNPA